MLADPEMPRFDARWVLESLPAARAEGESIARALGVGLLTGEEANETRFRQEITEAPVIHLATHGIAFSDPARSRASFLALAEDPENDGFLTVEEVLDGEAFPELSAELVVLSACQTGLGDVRGAEGTIGLQRAFLARGAGSALVSLWSVSDAGTYQLLTTFYRFWIGEGLPISEALRRAKIEMESFGADASVWASFQLYERC